MNPTTKPSSTSQSSILRPRTRRLISSLDEELTPADPIDTNARLPHATPPFASPYGSRVPSPIPSTHPSRSNSTQRLPRSTKNGKARSGLRHSSAQEPLSSFAGLWGNSWSAIQGLASNVLGSDISGSSSKDTALRKRPIATHRKSPSSAPSQWGPAGPSKSQIGVGSKEERESLVRVMKKKDLLSANGHVYPDSSGNFKRRNSDDRLSASAPPAEHDDRDALVYVHQVKPQDTLAGLSIKYNCQATILQKANRMWPNDTIQSRQMILLPVDACAVKGRPIPSPVEERREEDLLFGSAQTDENAPTPTSAAPNGWHRRESFRSQTPTTERRPSSTAASSVTDSEPPWKHDSWVILGNDTTPTEIARLPRRTLGFFPPPRRKSVTFSDASATPSVSLDLPRSSTTSASSPGSTHMNSYFSNHPSNIPPRHSHHLSLSSSITTTTSSSRPRTSSLGHSHNPWDLHGPGGVGTLSKNVRTPGPAQDGLNKLFGNRLLDAVEPPAEQTGFIPWNPGLVGAGDESISEEISEAGGASSASVGFDLENMGGAIEGWVRRMASKASKASKALAESSGSPGSRRPGSLAPAGMHGGRDVGDLIELTESFEAGGDEHEEDTDRKRGRRRSVSRERDSRAGNILIGGTMRDANHSSCVRSRARVKGRAISPDAGN